VVGLTAMTDPTVEKGVYVRYRHRTENMWIRTKDFCGGITDPKEYLIPLSEAISSEKDITTLISLGG
jgi:hypothetical protein